jgi:integrating conjugative element protein (TIGR03759 family)
MASINVPGITESQLSVNVYDQTLSKTGLKENIDDITVEQDVEKVNLTEKDKHHARVWGLTELEEKRYLLLMDNKSPVYYEGLRLTPIDILGINARNDAERDHFAEISANLEAAHVSKNIAWNNAFFKAYQKKVGNLKVIENFDPRPYAPSSYKPIILKDGDILNFFVKKTDPVTTIIQPLVSAIQSSHNTSINLFIVDADSTSAQKWALNHSIPVELVNSGRITINIGDMAFQSLNIKEKSTPILLLSKNGKSKIIDLGSI